MSLACPTCQKILTCSNCPPKTNKTEIIELAGILQRNLGTKQTKDGKDYYFGKLKLDNDTEQTIFFFEPDYNLSLRLQDLAEGEQIAVTGFYNKMGSFTAKSLISEDKVIF